MFVTFVA